MILIECYTRSLKNRKGNTFTIFNIYLKIYIHQLKSFSIPAMDFCLKISFFQFPADETKIFAVT